MGKVVRYYECGSHVFFISSEVVHGRGKTYTIKQFNTSTGKTKALRTYTTQIEARLAAQHLVQELERK